MDDVAVGALGQSGLDVDLFRIGSVVERRPALAVFAERDHIGIVGVEVGTLGIAYVVVPLDHRYDAAVAVITGPLP